MTNSNEFVFHGYYDITKGSYGTFQSSDSPDSVYVVTRERKLCYRFYPHFHPFVGKLISRLLKKSFAGLQAADTDYEEVNGKMVTLPNGKPKPVLYEELFTATQYNPSADMVDDRYPVKDLDFSSSGAYAVYNWELFYHVPFMMAVHLSKNQHFEEAQRWFHYVFDPTDDSEGPTPERFWKVRPFQSTDIKQLEELLVNLSSPESDPELFKQTLNSIEEWKNTPFRPHVIARFRPSAYMLKTVMAYLDNLIAWGDSLFVQDTGETINEAMQLYVLAANILGPRPQAIPKKGAVKSQNYAGIRSRLDAFSNLLEELEVDIPFDLAPHPNDASNVDKTSTINSLGKTLYFCVPHNEKLLSYWDMVADKLFKIHNSLNSQGIFRQLPLFEPPIDPALLAQAAAAGMDIGAVVSGINQPLPLVRFWVLVQKATEICQEVKSLGNNLLSAIEKHDNEALSILRAHHETSILKKTQTLKYQQWQEAIKNREGLEQSLLNTAQRYYYYERLLGKQNPAADIPQLDALDKDSLLKMKFSSSDPQMGLRKIEVDIAQEKQGDAGDINVDINLDLGTIIGGAVGGLLGGPMGGVIGAAIGNAVNGPSVDIASASADPGANNITGGKKLSSYEAEELAHLNIARTLQVAAGKIDRAGAVISVLPQISVQAMPLGVGGSISLGSDQLSKAVSMISSAVRTNADEHSFEASNVARIGSYARREQEWAYQSNTAAGEISQIFKQLRAAQIREHMAEQELKNHQSQITFAEEVENFFTDEKNGKTANIDFYSWMKGEVKGLYAQCFQFAYEIAKKAERALQHELGNYEVSFLQYSYLAGKQGLLAGEKLYMDIKRMETAYHDLNQREYELTKHVSLLQVSPEAMLQLRLNGKCTVSLPEELSDMDGPGHYFRRIKSVSVSIPCIAGPYTSISCTLTLLKSAIRKNTLLNEGNYSRQGSEDNRFSEYFGSLQSIVTSTGQNDSGMFETNLHDERYLPFEGSGVISEWQLELPSDVRQFDFNTISDVIMHMRFTAREGGGLLKKEAVKNLKERIENAEAVGSMRLFSIRHEFSNDWAKFKNIKLGSNVTAAELTLTLRAEHYPFWSQGGNVIVKQVVFFAKSNGNLLITDGTGKEDTFISNALLGDLQTGKLNNISLPLPTGKFTIYLNNNLMDDMWVMLTWGKENN